MTGGSPTDDLGIRLASLADATLAAAEARYAAG